MMLTFIRRCLVAGLLLAGCTLARAQLTTTGQVHVDGPAAQYLDGPAPFLAEGNLARRPGAVAIAKDVLPGSSAHTIAHLNDGVYGNGNSWIGSSATSWAGIGLGKSTRLTGFAFSRDNAAGGLFERTAGTYRVQYSQSPSIGGSTVWTELGTVVNPGTTAVHGRRQRFSFTSPIEATFFRLLTPNGACIDEIELYDAAAPELASPWLTAGKFSQAFATGLAAAHWAEAPLLAAYQQRPLTAECWVKLNSTLDYNVILAAGSKDFDVHWLLATEPASGVFYAYLPGSSPVSVSSNVNIADGAWHYLAMVLEPARVRLYVDGTQRADRALGAGPVLPGNEGGFYLGGYPAHHQGCDGVIDEVRLSSGARTIGASPTSAFGADAATIALWHFDEAAAGATYTDASTRANASRLAPPAAAPAINLRRGVTLDRQYHNLPSTPVFRAVDIRLIKNLKFDHVKLVANPAIHKSGAGVVPASMTYLDSAIQLVVNEGLPVVITLHPEPDFKYTVLGGGPTEFNNFLSFLNAFGAHLAAHWTPHQVAMQIMTEPFANPGDWTPLQFRMWEALRKGMPNHMIILGGDQVGHIKGLLPVTPVNDRNVMYCFTTYDPFEFTLQGGNPFGWVKDLTRVPYPVTPALVEDWMTTMTSRIPAGTLDGARAALRRYGEQSWSAEMLRARFARLADWNQFHGGKLALWCAEYGVLGTEFGTVNPDHRYRFVEDLRTAFEANGIRWAYWSFNETFTCLLPKRVPLAPYMNTSWTDTRMMQAFGLDPNNAARDWLGYW